MDRKLQRHRADSLRQHGFLVLRPWELTSDKQGWLSKPHGLAVYSLPPLRLHDLFNITIYNVKLRTFSCMCRDTWISINCTRIIHSRSFRRGAMQYRASGVDRTSSAGALYRWEGLSDVSSSHEVRQVADTTLYSRSAPLDIILVELFRSGFRTNVFAVARENELCERLVWVLSDNALHSPSDFSLH